MAEIYNPQQQSIKGTKQSAAVSQLDKLEQGLRDKKQQAFANGSIEEIPLIDKALDQIKEARKLNEDSNINAKIASHQARLGKPKVINEESQETLASGLTEAEANSILQIRSVSGAYIAPGQVFQSMYGPKEPSQVSHLKANIGGLFELVNKNVA